MPGLLREDTNTNIDDEQLPNTLESTMDNNWDGSESGIEDASGDNESNRSNSPSPSNLIQSNIINANVLNNNTSNDNINNNNSNNNTSIANSPRQSPEPYSRRTSLSPVHATPVRRLSLPLRDPSPVQRHRTQSVSPGLLSQVCDDDDIGDNSTLVVVSTDYNHHPQSINILSNDQLLPTIQISEVL